MARAPGTVRDLLRRRLGVPTSPLTSATNLITTPTSPIRQKPHRVSFLFVNLGSFPAFLLPKRTVEPSATIGIKVEPDGGSLFVDWETDGEMVAWEWRGIAPGGTSAFLLLENLIDPGRTVEEAPE